MSDMKLEIIDDTLVIRVPIDKRLCAVCGKTDHETLEYTPPTLSALRSTFIGALLGYRDEGWIWLRQGQGYLGFCSTCAASVNESRRNAEQRIASAERALLLQRVGKQR